MTALESESGARILVLMATLCVKPEQRWLFLPAAIEHARGSLKEPGVLRFDISQDQGEPNRFYIYKVYQDQAALDAHVSTPRFARWREITKDCFAQPPTVVRSTSVYPQELGWQ